MADKRINSGKSLTRKRFESLLKKAAQPLPKKECVLKETETAESHPSDGYSGKCKSPDKIEDKED